LGQAKKQKAARIVRFKLEEAFSTLVGPESTSMTGYGSFRLCKMTQREGEWTALALVRENANLSEPFQSHHINFKPWSLDAYIALQAELYRTVI